MPDYNQFNMYKARDTDQSKVLKTKSPYASLLDGNPAEPSTVFLAMIKAQRITQEAGQGVTFFTVDLQIHKVSFSIIRTYETLIVA